MKVMVIVKASPHTEAGGMPSEQVLTAMGQFNAELVKAGILLAMEGLHPTSKGVRVEFPAGTVIDGPFAETKELIGGFWLWRVASMQEAIDWLRRSPFRHAPDAQVEVRPVIEPDEFGAAFTPELRAQEAWVLAEAARNAAKA